MEKKMTILAYEDAYDNALVIERGYDDNALLESIDEDSMVYIRGYEIPFVALYSDSEIVVVYCNTHEKISNEEVEERIQRYYSDDFKEHYTKNGRIAEKYDGIFERENIYTGYYWGWKTLKRYEDKVVVWIDKETKTVSAIYENVVVGSTKYEHEDELNDLWFVANINDEIYDINIYDWIVGFNNNGTEYIELFASMYLVIDNKRQSDSIEIKLEIK